MRVLMLGPGEGMIGGILTLAETVIPILQQRVNLMYFETVKRRPLKESGKVTFRNLSLSVVQFARFIQSFYLFRPNIIHLHTSQGIAWLKDTIYVLLAKLHRCHVVVHVHAESYDKLYGKNSYLVKHYTRWVMGLADAIIAVSDEWTKRLADIGPAERVFTFKNCIAVSAVTPRLPHYLKDRAKVLFLGSVGPRKGAFDLLEAMGRLKSNCCSIEAWIAGYEERKGDLLKVCVRREELQLGDNYQLLGTVCGAKKIDLLSKASVFVLPSYNEGLPMAILEAMAAGLPIVSTPVGGIPEVVKDGYNGFLIPPGDVEALAERLAILARDPHLCEVMGKRSWEIAVQELDVKPYVERLVALYEMITN